MKKQIIEKKRKFVPRPFRLDTKRKKRLIDYCLLLGYIFDDYSYDYPVIRKDDKFAYISVIGDTLYAIYIDNENEYTPIFINLDNPIYLMYKIIKLSKIDINEYRNKSLISGYKLYHIMLSIIFFENYDFKIENPIGQKSIEA